MSTTDSNRRHVSRRTFLAMFACAALIIAGIVSYAASSAPDGLDSATLRGCETVMVGGSEQLTGDCIAQHATDHAMSSSPLADYSLHGIGATNGVAGVIGVVVTLAIATGLFWLLAVRRRARADHAGADGGGR